ncbi:MAG TPA: CPBP family intramembrane glutamic endopeptidase [Candidatus Baltobacteraceae bacterium]|nr:CPBP family intramembrane glutamic endopeptidase [Candidatus Baltobacteraceae bacterium]
MIVTIGISGAIFNKIIPASAGMPLWEPSASAFSIFLTRHLPTTLTEFGITNGIRNFIFDLVPLGIVLFACGLGLRDMGLGRFRPGSLKVALIWLTIPIVAFIAIVATHQRPLSFVALLWLSNLLQNGLTEELLFRGMILGRLRNLLGNDWGLVTQALLFGMWHYGLDLSTFHGNILLAASSMITSQALFGYAWGFVALRTGNVLIGSACHLLSDSISEIPNLANSFVSLF